MTWLDIPTPGGLMNDYAGSVLRRVRFADACRYHLDVLQGAIGLRRKTAARQWCYLGLCFAHDLVERYRTGQPVRHPGHAQRAALDAPLRLEQHPRHRGYWYDSDRHALVGVLLGLDFHRHAGRYHLIEANLTASLKAERRSMYPETIDPYLRNLIQAAKRSNFRKIVLYRSSWTEENIRDIDAAGEAYGITIAAHSTLRRKGYREIDPMPALPEPLERDTMYVALSGFSESPVFLFLRHKDWLARWFEEEWSESGELYSLIKGIPASPRPDVIRTASDERWPNLVMKLASSDQCNDVLMGRFKSEAHAREVLQLPPDGSGLPIQFRKDWYRKWTNRLSPGRLSTVYQPYVQPEVVDGRARVVRLLLFLSPLVDAFLSAHGKLGGERLPDHLPYGLVENSHPFVVGFAAGGSYHRLESDIEDELVDVAQEFGDIARRGIARKFVIGPERPGVAEEQEQVVPAAGL